MAEVPVYMRRPSYEAPKPLTYEEFLAMQGINPSPQGQQANPSQQLQKGITDKVIEQLSSPSSPSNQATGSTIASGLGSGVASGAGASTTFSSGAVYAGEAIGTAANGGTIMSTGAVIPASEGAAIASGGASAPVASTLGSIAGVAAPIAAIAFGAKTAYDFGKGKKLSTPQKLAMAIPTAGASLFSDSIQKKFGIGQNRTGKNQQSKIKELVSSGYMPENMPGVSEGIIQDKGHGDKELYSGKLKGRDVWGVSGMFDTFKEDWLGKYTESQREKIAQRALDERLLDSRKGLTRVVNPERLKQIAEEEFSGKVAQPNINIAVTRPVANQTQTKIPKAGRWQ